MEHDSFLREGTNLSVSMSNAGESENGPSGLMDDQILDYFDREDISIGLGDEIPNGFPGNGQHLNLRLSGGNTSIIPDPSNNDISNSFGIKRELSTNSETFESSFSFGPSILTPPPNPNLKQEQQEVTQYISQCSNELGQLEMEFTNMKVSQHQIFITSSMELQDREMIMQKQIHLETAFKVSQEKEEQKGTGQNERRIQRRKIFREYTHLPTLFILRTSTTSSSC